MKKMKVVFVFYLCSILIGCFSKPDISDVEPEITEFWKPCEFLKPTNFKKTNGIDKGKEYEMAVYYELELIDDIPEKSECVVSYTRRKALEAVDAQNKMQRKAVKGDRLKVETSFLMVESENGWIIQ